MIGFDLYLDIVHHLSLYRARFLSVSVEDLEKAFFGEKAIKRIDYSGLKKLNLPLTLSVEYGVPPQVACQFVAEFLRRIILDTTIPEDVLERIFIEIVDVFPSTMKKHEVSQLLLFMCTKLVEKEGSEYILTTLASKSMERIKRLSNAPNIWK